MEWAYLGERGDTYRGMGYPNNFDGKYQIIPKDPLSVGPLTDYFYTIELGFYYSGDNEDIQKSQKQLTLVTNSSAVATSIVTNLQALTGLTATVIN